MADQVSDTRQPGFFWIDNFILTEYASRIRSHGIAVYAVLCMHGGGRKATNVSLDRLAGEAGIETREAVLKYLSILQDVGLIRIIRRPGRGGNIYQIMDVFGDPGTVRPSRPSARIKPVNRDVDKSVDSQDGTVGVTDSSTKNGRRSRQLPAPEMVGVADNLSPKLSATPTRTRDSIDTISRQEIKDDDARARKPGRSSSSSRISRPDLETQFGERAVKMALEIAENAGKPGSLRYAAGVLRNWAREGTMPRKARGINPYDWEPVRETETNPDDWTAIDGADDEAGSG